MPHFRRFGTKQRNTTRNVNTRPGILEAERLLAKNPGADRRDLVDQLVMQRQFGEKKFRGIPESTIQKILDRINRQR